MTKFLLTPFVSLVFLACGGGSGTTLEDSPTASDVIIPTGDSTTPLTTATSEETDTSTNTPQTPSAEVDTSTDSVQTIEVSSLKMAVNNTGTIIKENFDEFVLQIIVSEPLHESEETSNSTIAVYGVINGSSTKSLLKLNTNYVGKTVSVAVFKDERLVAQSETFKVNNTNPINFGEITIK